MVSVLLWLGGGCPLVLAGTGGRLFFCLPVREAPLRAAFPYGQTVTRAAVVSQSGGAAPERQRRPRA